MNASRHIVFCTILIFSGFSQFLAAQPGYKVDIKKPKPYEERVLKAEKTGDGKLSTPKRALQNLTTHFNYFFNANNKLNEVLERAKAAHRDDYSSLLPFYNYTLAATSAEKMQLDSVIYKAQTGLVMHDLRNDWTDELYLLWGAAYFFRNELDSASQTFQFINYAYAEKEKDGYYQYVGSPKEGETALTISSKEKKGLFSNTSSRNNAFIWQIRTLTEIGKYSEAAGLINTLKNDPNFPKRLNDALEETQAYWFYKQKMWDSSATHLVIAAEHAPVRQEKARWEYLAAQMFEKSGKVEDAKLLYAKSIPHTTDPVMEVYARLNLVRLNKTSDGNYVERNIAELLKMAKRDKYEDYRDVIYYMAAQMEMERNNLEAAQELLAKGSKYNNGNLASRSKAFLQLADLSYTQKKYIQAASFYDSIQGGNLTQPERDRINERKPVLAKITGNLSVIQRQDSFQKIAAMPEAERNAYLEKLVKQLRRQRGLKDEPLTTGSGSSSTLPDLFAGSPSKGEWYFYNSTLKTQGQQQFRQVWGNRPNVDNWRRASKVSQQIVAQNQINSRNGSASAADGLSNVLSVESLAGNIPLTPEALTKSDDSIKAAMNSLGAVYLNEAEDYPSAIDILEQLRKRYPYYEKMDEVLFNLYHAYTKAGERGRAAQIKNLLVQGHPSSRFTAIAQTGNDPAAKASISPQSTKEYEAIYNMFIEGKFEQAEAAKKRADSVYKTNYWEPQLLYIEAVYHIQQRNDSVARNLLQTIVKQEPNSALGKKAQNLIRVLGRRSQIENELAEHQIQNQPEVSAPQPQPQQPVKMETPQVKRDTATTTPPVTKDIITAKPPATKDTATTRPPVTKPADTVAKQPIKTVKDTVNNKPAPKNIDTVSKQPLPKPVDTVKKQPLPKASDTVVKKAAPPVQPQVIPGSPYTLNPDAQHYAVVVLNKVDPVFVNEARNAFARFNKEKYYTQPLEAQVSEVSGDVRLIIVGNFQNAQAASDYVQQAKRYAVSEIIPWLAKDKYTFSIITTANLETLKSLRDWNSYKKFTDQYLPGKF